MIIVLMGRCVPTRCHDMPLKLEVAGLAPEQRLRFQPADASVPADRMVVTRFRQISLHAKASASPHPKGVLIRAIHVIGIVSADRAGATAAAATAVAAVAVDVIVVSVVVVFAGTFVGAIALFAYCSGH